MGSGAPPAHGARPGPVLTVLRALPATTKPMDALRTAVSAWGATQDLPWPPTAEQARALTSFSPSALAAFARLRAGAGAGRAGPLARPRRGVPLSAHRRAPGPGHRPCARRLLHRRRGAWLQRLDVHGPGRDLDPIGHRLGGRRPRSGRSRARSTAARRRRSSTSSTRSGRPTMPRHGSATTLARGERLMGFGHRVYRAYDPRAAALRKVAEAHAEPAGLAPARDRRRGRRRCASSPRSTRSGRSRPTSSTTRRPSSWASA